MFRMWYSVAMKSPPCSSLAYAESGDGLHWEAPSLGLIDYGGFADNNLRIGLDQGGASVLLDPHDPDPARRYKLMHKRPWKEGVEVRVTISFPPERAGGLSEAGPQGHRLPAVMGS